MSRTSFAAAAACVALAVVPIRGAAADETQALAALRAATAAERVLKLQAQLGQGLLTERGRRQLSQALGVLDASVRAIGVPASPPELHESASLLAILCAQYRARVSRPASRDAARALGERAEEIDWEAGRVARLAMPAPPLALAAEHAAALAERIGRLVLWRRWGVEPGGRGGGLADARSGLAAALTELRSQVDAGAAADAELRVAENQASFLLAADSAGELAPAGTREAEFLAKASDNTRESLERLATLLASAGR